MEPTVSTASSDSTSFWVKFRDNLTELIEFAAIMGAILLVIHLFVAEPHKVSGRSMDPNFQDGDYIITDKISSHFTDYKRGEVIILKNPLNTDQVFIKRIIGQPGDTIKVLNNHVYVNGQLDQEPYLKPSVTTFGGRFLPEGESLTLPPNQYFVMGDNRNESSDSREWGLLDKSLIVGYPWLRYWPLDRFTVIQTNAPS